MEGPPPPPPPLPPPPPPVPVTVALETEAVVFAVVLIGEGVAEAETDLNEDAASNIAAVDARRMLSMHPAAFLLLLAVEPVAVVVEANIKAAVG